MSILKKRQHRRIAITILLWLTLGVTIATTHVTPAKPSTASANFLLSARAADGIVPGDLRSLIAQLTPRASAAIAEHRTMLGRALALERLVHTAVRPTDSDCWGYATLMTALGRTVGLPVRLMVSGTGVSNYDTHTTVAVWLPHYARWGIVDPTFGGFFTRSGNARPLGAVDLRDSLVEGWWPQVHWHSSAHDSTSPAGYYVDPVFLFRYVGTYADVAGSVAPIALPDSTVLVNAKYAATPSIFASTPARHSVTAEVASAFAGEQTSTNGFALPPAYAPREVWFGRVSLPATISIARDSVAVWVSEPGVNVGGYGTALVHGGSLSPVFVSHGKVRITGNGRVTVRVFRARTFPSWLES